ncbi:MAG: CRISPR-associated protein Cas4 [Suipraeoptans sp.]
MYNEEDYLQLSGIQHFAFCKRQWALAYIEMQWSENVRTVEGKLLHEKVHDVFSGEKRREVVISRAMPVYSRTMGVSGECDVVEFHRNENGISIAKMEGKFNVIPIEYKRGEAKVNDIDEMQLVAQGMCLEEMLCCTIPYGYIFYGKTRRREKVVLSPEIKSKVVQTFEEMHKYSQRGYTPKVRRSKSCNACSLKDICLPAIKSNISVAQYIDANIEEGG